MRRRAHPVQLSPRFTHLVKSAETLILVGDDDSVLLEVPEATAVLGQVDGEATAQAIAEALEPGIPRPVTYFVLLALEKEGIVREGPQEAELVPGGSDGQSADEPIASLARVLERAWLARAASRAVLIPSDGDDRPTLLLTDDYLEPSLAEAVGRAPRGRTLLLRLSRGRILVGPELGSEGAPCVACVQARMHLNLAARALIHAVGDQDDISIRSLSTSMPDQAFREAARAALVWPDRRQTGHGILVVEPGDAPLWHPAQRLPHCPACGDPGLVEPGAELNLEHRRRAPGSAGGYRTITPAQTLERYGDLVSPLTGVVRRIAKVPVEGTDLIHVYSASHALRGGPSNLKAVRDDRREHSGGKGRTDLDAHVSALCESLERYSSICRGTESTREARQSDLGRRAVSPAHLLLFSQAQLDAREAWNAQQAGHFQFVPEPYADECIEWSAIRSLTTGETRFVPSSFVFFSFPGAGSRFCKADSNGLAGGNCLEEAVLQGLLELVERDAIAIWWYNRLQRPALDLGSAQDPWVGALLEFYTSIQRDLWVLDLTSDVGIPCFAAVSARTDRVPEEPIFGFGAHLEPAIALSRALTEVNQMLPTVLRPEEDRRRQLLPDFADAIDWWETARLQEHAYLLPAHGAHRRPVSHNRPPDTRHLLGDIEYCVGKLSEVGCEVLVYDLTRPDVGFAVAKVVAPGLRHMWRRLGPGRLYDVPVQEGWIPEKRSEDHLNPVSLFV